MPRGACSRCHRVFTLNPESRFQPACPRCRQPLRLIPDDEARVTPRAPAKPGPAALAPPGGRFRPVAPALRRWTARRTRATGMVGACLLMTTLLWGHGHRRQPFSPRVLRFSSAPKARSLSDEALEAAQQWRVRAEREALAPHDRQEPWEPQAPGRLGGVQTEAGRLSTTSDPSNALRQALAQARRAAAVAQTPDETFRAALLLSRLECDAGDHEVELQTARRLVALRPQAGTAQLALQHAAVCNGLDALARQAETAAKKLGFAPDPLGSSERQLGPTSPSDTAFAAALREAHRWNLWAMSAVSREREQLELWDPKITARVSQTNWDSLMAADHSGARRKALAAAERAASLAQTKEEEYQAAELLARLECYGGQHDPELRQARKLMAL